MDVLLHNNNKKIVFHYFNAIIVNLLTFWNAIALAFVNGLKRLKILELHPLFATVHRTLRGPLFARGQDQCPRQLGRRERHEWADPESTKCARLRKSKSM